MAEGKVLVHNEQQCGTGGKSDGDSGSGTGTGETSYGKSNSNISQLLADKPELTGTNREKLLSMVQNSKLASIINEVYRSGELGLNDLDIAEALRDDLVYAIDLFK